MGMADIALIGVITVGGTMLLNSVLQSSLGGGTAPHISKASVQDPYARASSRDPYGQYRHPSSSNGLIYMGGLGNSSSPRSSSADGKAPNLRHIRSGNSSFRGGGPGSGK